MIARKTFAPDCQTHSSKGGEHRISLNWSFHFIQEKEHFWRDVDDENIVRPVFVSDAVMRDRLRRYVNDHVKYASRSAIMPSVRAVSYAANY